VSRKRIAWVAVGTLAGLLLVAAAAAVVVFQSRWFYNRVRAGIVDTVETATGGRVEIGSFRFDWRTLRAEVDRFTLHGTEPPDKPPLFRAESVAVGLKVVSILKRNVDISYLDVTAPQVDLIVGPDGRTNVPEPKIAKKAGKPVVQSILDLAIGRFSLERGQFEVASGGKTPFAASGRNLNARFVYDLAGPRYRGDVSIQPLHVEAGGYRPMPVGIAMALTLEANRVAISSARLVSGASSVVFSGAIENLASPQGAFQYDARISVAEATPILRIPELHHGTVELRGKAAWTDASSFSVSGALDGFDLAYRDPSIRLEGFRAAGALTAGPKGVEVNGLRLAGSYVTDAGRAPVESRIHTVALRGRDLQLQLHGIALTVFGGTFQGDATVLDLKRYSAGGAIAGIEARPLVAMYSSVALPWNALASGTVAVEGSFERSAELRASATLTVGPAPDSAPVHGQIAATYQARDRTLDLGHSTVTLPSSQVDFSGTLGRRMRVHLDTRNLDDLLPAIGEKAASLPARLTGTAIFDGTVTGTIDNPQISGHTRVTGISYAGESFDSLEADADVSPAGVRLRRATVAQGQLRAQFEVSVGLDDWKGGDSSPLSGSGTLRGGTVAELETLLDLKDIPLDGAAAGAAQISGTIGDPRVAADFELTRGNVRDEPFDRFTGHLDYSTSLIELTAGQLNASDGQATIFASYHHAPGHFDTGFLDARVSTNARSLERVRTLQKEYPGLKGTVQLSAAGEFHIAPPRGSGLPFRVTNLTADVTGHGLQLGTQTLGDTRLLVSSQGAVLHAHLESTAANSEVSGDGEWRLEGDYPGTATIAFSRLDLGRLRAWIDPSSALSASPYSGSVEGQLRIDGPLLKEQALTAELRIPKFEFGPAAAGDLPAGKLMLHNSGPLVAVMANNVVTVESARLTGEDTDFSVTGKVSLLQKSPLDLRAAGRVDLALLHDVNRDFTSSGAVAADATVRGTFDAPLINGRVEFQKAAFNLEGIPNGISNANGVVVFSGDKTNGTRATIQSFSGETGGGKVDLSGFAGFNGGQSIFRLHAVAREVRIRYPEGVSTVANASLNLTGSEDRSMLEGSVTIVRTGFNPQSDFSSLLAASAEPVETPAARTGLVGGMNFDIQINTAPDIQFQSSLTEDVQMEANLRLRGTFSNPAVLGRINITQGQVIFFGTKYTINQGSVQFFNPVRIDPILDVDLEAKANGIDVTLNISGPFNKPNLTPRSDPPLQFNEIVALLATGRSPTSDPSRLAQESTAPQSWQQMGASALLGQALASPVTGRLQRFFGVSQLRIDPTLPGVESNPQARLTLQQQVTSDITFTYITDVTNSNPQAVRVEWSFAKQWSAVALREDNGVFGLDFFYKRRF
jgi:translocation and assembly module TamB